MKKVQTLGLIKFTSSLVALIIFFNAVSAQTATLDSQETLEKRIESLEKKLSQTERELKKADSKLSEDVDRTSKKLEAISKDQASLEQRTSSAVEDFDKRAKSSEQSISEKFESLRSGIKDEITSSTMTPIYGLAVVVLLTIGGFVFFRHRARKDVDEVIAHVDATRASLQAESVQLDEKLLSFLEGEVERPGRDLAKDDHSLPLKVADEVVRIQNYVSYIDPNLKGVKHLSASVKRIEDYLLTKGYEIPPMLGRDYNDGMKVIANFKSDENLQPGEQKITRIIKPQVNFNGQMIQAAEIEVSLG